MQYDLINLRKYSGGEEKKKDVFEAREKGGMESSVFNYALRHFYLLSKRDNSHKLLCLKRL